MTEHSIIDTILAGNSNAYSILVDTYKNRVVTLAYNILLNREDAEEVAQDAFVKAFYALKEFKKQAAFGTWLYRIVINTALNKKKQKKLFVIDITQETINDEPADFENLLHQYENKDLGEFLRSAMQTLNDDERICITLFYLNELQVNEIHELTGKSVANIKVILYRGRKHLYDAINRLLKKETENLI